MASEVYAVPHMWSETVWGRAALSAPCLPSSPWLPSEVPGRGKLALVMAQGLLVWSPSV